MPDNAPEKQPENRDHGFIKYWKPVAILLVIAALVAVPYFLPVSDALERLGSFIEELGPLGPLALIIIYIVATVACMPGLVLTIVAGGLFGLVWGTVYVSVGSTIGASLCFLISRYFARDAIEKWVAKHERFRKLDALSEKHGAEIVAICRLVPIFPFNLLNYGLGLTRVRFWIYVLCSWLFMLPGTAMYVAGGAFGKQWLQEKKAPTHLIIAFTGILVIVMAAAKIARKRLKEREGSIASGDTQLEKNDGA